MNFKPEAIHTDLGTDFFDKVSASNFPKHILRYRNQRWAERVGLDELSETNWLAHFGAFEPFEGSFETPIALRYHGHQFRSYNPDLGDGRGFLFAQMRDLKDNRLLDFGTKGTGQTPWSRQGDGRLTLKGGVREILATEMLEALGVNTSKTFSIVETGEDLHRGDEPSPTRSAVMVRLSHSHIRIGSFQRQATLKRADNLEKLMDHSIKHYMPDVWRDNVKERVLAFLARVSENVAKTGAEWTLAGFVHGVLNTDNINVTGESFDYGPWRFLPNYDPAFTAAYFDSTGLYSFGRQPETLLWNLARLAECFLDFAEPEELETALSQFWNHFQRNLAIRLCDRLGIEARALENNTEHAMELLRGLIEFWSETQAAYEQTIFDLRGGLRAPDRLAKSPQSEHYNHAKFASVKALLADRFTTAGDDVLDHPYFARETPRTMLIEEVEAIWDPIAASDDWGRFEQTIQEIQDMRIAYGTAR